MTVHQSLEIEWRPIPSFKGLYDVSSIGEIRGVKRGKIMSPYVTHNGYLAVKLSAANQRSNVRVHRAVAEAFLGPAPRNEMTVNHKDFCKTNNHYSNLEWCTGIENMRHYNSAVSAGELGRVQKRGEEIYNARLSEDDVLQIKRMLLSKDRPTYQAIADQYRVAMTTISSIRNGHSWKHVSCGRPFE